MKGGEDKARAVLRISGSDHRRLLGDLVTNSLDGLARGAIYAALLTPQGKYLFDFFLVADGDDTLLDVAADRAPALAQRLVMYKLRSDMQVGAADLRVFHGIGPAPGGAVDDPRHKSLGWRLYAEAAPQGLEPMGDDEWDAIRVEHLIPESGRELIPEESYILECGFERLHGVDFRKGCYVGQEVTARMRHKTELKKGLARVRIEGAAPAPGTEITVDGKPSGALHTVSGNEAIAYLRFDRAEGEMLCGGAILRRVPDGA